MHLNKHTQKQNFEVEIEFLSLSSRVPFHNVYLKRKKCFYQDLEIISSLCAIIINGITKHYEMRGYKNSGVQMIFTE